MTRQTYTRLIALAFCATLIAVPSAVPGAAQDATLDGDWEMIAQWDPDIAEVMPVAIVTDEEGFTFTVTRREQEQVLEATIQDDELTVIFEISHGQIICTMQASSEDEYAGTCVGPQREVPVSLDRKKAYKKEPK